MISQESAKISADIAEELFDQFLTLTLSYANEPNGGDILIGTMVAFGAFVFATMVNKMSPDERDGFREYLFENITYTANSLLADPAECLKHTEED